MRRPSNGSFLALLLACFLAAPVAFAGNEGSGGGNAGKSTPQDVRDALSHIRGELGQFYFTACTGWFNGLDPELAKIFATVCPQGSYTFEQTTLGKDIGTDDGKVPGAPFVTIADGPCHDLDGNESDAAVTARTPLTPICFSIPRLQNIPPEAIQRRAFALGAHEFVHHFNNFGEVEALKVQVFALEHYEEVTGNDGFKMSLAFYLDNVRTSAGILQSLLNRSDRTDETTCLAIGQLDDLTWAMEVAVSRYKISNFGFDDRGYELMSRAAGLSYYCGKTGYSHGRSEKYAVQLKDLTGLRTKLGEFAQMQSKFRDDVKKALGVTVQQ